MIIENVVLGTSVGGLGAGDTIQVTNCGGLIIGDIALVAIVGSLVARATVMTVDFDGLIIKPPAPATMMAESSILVKNFTCRTKQMKIFY